MLIDSNIIALIAATAIFRDLDLLTENIKDYRGIQELNVLSVDDFLKA